MLPVIGKVLVASAARTATGNSGAIAIGSDLLGGLFVLDCTAYSSLTSVDVSVEVTPDGGTTWFEVFRFTQLTATAQHQILANFDRKIDAGAIRAVTTGGTGALNANCPISDPVRVKWTMAGSGSATFGVYLIANRREV